MAAPLWVTLPPFLFIHNHSANNCGGLMERLVLLVFLGLVAGQAQAGEGRLNGSGLLEYCSGPESGFGHGVCGGYVTGVHDLQGKPLFCTPLDVTNGQLQLVVKKWLQEHPEKLHYTASGLVVEAFKEAFPCK